MAAGDRWRGTRRYCDDLRGLRLDPARLLVVYDDVDIPLGEIRIRKDGGPGTHKGMISIVQEIGTSQFPRLRVGIGTESAGGDIVRYVLSVRPVPEDKTVAPAAPAVQSPAPDPRRRSRSDKK